MPSVSLFSNSRYTRFARYDTSNYIIFTTAFIKLLPTYVSKNDIPTATNAPITNIHAYFASSVFRFIFRKFSITFENKIAFTATIIIVGNNIISCGIINVNINDIPLLVPKLDNIDVTVNPIE